VRPSFALPRTSATIALVAELDHAPASSRHRTLAVAVRRPLPPDDPTSALLARLADGDRGVASDLFRLLWSPVRRLAGTMLRHDADADDAAQDAMVTIFARVSDYDRTRAGLPWALAIAGYACRTTRKKRSRRREDLDHAVAEVAAPSQAEDALEQQQMLEAAVATLDVLSATDRETLLATYWEEHQASASGATLRKRRERALDRLRILFRSTYGLG
jgi:RNA polymerase sigma-70 factor (ECF subfamily)